MHKLTTGTWFYNGAGIIQARESGAIIADLDSDEIPVAETDTNGRVMALSPTMLETIHKLLTARKESSQAFLKMSYSSEVQEVFDIVESIYTGIAQ